MTFCCLRDFLNFRRCKNPLLPGRWIPSAVERGEHLNGPSWALNCGSVMLVQLYIYIYIYKRGEKNISSCHPLNPVHPYKQRVSIPILWIRNNKKITLKIFKINSSPGYTHTVWQKSVRPLNEGAGLQCSPRIWYCMMRRAGRDCSTFLQSNGWLKNWAMFNIPLWFHFTGWLIALILKILGNIIPDNDQPARVLNTAQLALSTAILTTRPWTWIVCPAGC